METIIATSSRITATHIATIAAKKGSAFVGIAKSMLIEEAKRQMRNGVCHFVYLKKPNKQGIQEVREAYGTLNAALCNKHINGRGQSPETWGCSCYFDVEKGQFRSFRWQNIIDILS